MKKLLALIFFFLVVMPCFALEIQCKTNLSDVDFALKQSPETLRYYFLFFIDENVKVVPLEDDKLIITTSGYFYEDASFRFNLNEMNGELEIFREQSLSLHLCQSYDK